jgi:hypothetical protein
MNHEIEKPRVAFTPKEVRALKYHAVVVAAIAAAMYMVAPKGVGQLLGVLLAVLLLLVPPLVVYVLRRRKARE